MLFFFFLKLDRYLEILFEHHERDGKKKRPNVSHLEVTVKVKYVKLSISIYFVYAIWKWLLEYKNSMYILAYIVRLRSAPTSSRELQPCPPGNKRNHPMFPPLLLLCVLISTEWEPVHVDSTLYDNMSQYISWDKHKTKTAGSTKLTS